jgi:hypothetical protein
MRSVPTKDELNGLYRYQILSLTHLLDRIKVFGFTKKGME